MAVSMADQQNTPEESAEHSREEIDAALRAAGAESAPEPADSAELSQADIDAALEAETATGGEADQADAPVDDRVDGTGRPCDAAAAAMAAAIEEEAPPPVVPPPETSSVELRDFTREAGHEGDRAHGISLIQDVDLRVKIELGRTRMLVEDVLALGAGSVVELDKLAGDPVDVFVNDRLVARGEVLILNDNFCVRISEIVSNAESRQAG